MSSLDWLHLFRKHFIYLNLVPLNMQDYSCWCKQEQPVGGLAIVLEHGCFNNPENMEKKKKTLKKRCKVQK